MKISRTINQQPQQSRFTKKTDCGCSGNQPDLFDRFDSGALVLSSMVGTTGLYMGGTIGAPIGASWGRQIASSLTAGGAANPDFFPNLALGGSIGKIAGGVALAAIGFAAVTAGTYALMKAGEG
ncbi:MAG: hypothetical protein KC800_20240 [Candidatus Eremiobacteraeota bacterium]|nr:hypothetical protein [Candidatus Eremiobacteraeota bacterium]